MNRLSINRNTLIYLILFSFIYVFPLLLSNVFYADDVTRAVNGHYWDYDNRLLSNEIMRFFSFRESIKDFFPYTTIFSGFVFAICGYLVTKILQIESGSKIQIASLLFLTSPFLIENLAFRYDSPFMAISCLAAILPFCLVDVSNKIKFFISTLIGVIVIFLTYQASVSVFVILTLFVAINEIYKENLKKAITIVINGIVVVLLSFVLYKVLLLVTDSPSVGRDKFVIFSDDPIGKLAYNIECVYNLYKQVFNPHFIIGTIALLGAFFYGLFKFFKEKIKVYNKLLILVFILLIPVIIPLPLIVLENTYINPRVMIGFSLIMYGMLFIVNKYSQKLTRYISLYFVIIAFPLMSSLANILNNHDQFQTAILNDVMSKVDLQNKNIVIDGEVIWTNYSENIIKEYEFINYMHTKFIGNQNFGLEEFFRFKSNNLYKFQFPRDDKRSEILKNKMKLEIKNRTNYYILRADDNNVIIDFNKEEIFAPQLANLELKPADNAVANFDLVELQQNEYVIRGWSIIYGENSSNNTPKLILFNEQNTYVSNLYKEKRNDVSEAMEGPYNDSGFIGRINPTTLEKGIYTLGILLESPNGNKVIIKDNQITIQ